MRPSTVSAIAIVIVSMLSVSDARAHILAIAGAAGFDDQPFINLVQSLAAEERLVYASERPPGCTSFYVSPTAGADVMKGDGYTILLRPTGDAAMAPDWPMARNRLESEIQNFRSYLDAVDLPCECREYLHIVGFSDGASTTGGWLNNGALNTQVGDDHFGVVSLVDVIRKFNTLDPNTNINATWTVDAMPAGRSVFLYIAYRNRSGGFLEGCGFVTGDWTGHRILSTPSPWLDAGLLDNDTCHTSFPDHMFVDDDLVDLIQIATMDLINSDLALGRCNCIALKACPDLDGDGDVDLDDFDIFRQNITGPTVNGLLLGQIPGDIDLDGDVDLRDYGFFQQAFSVSGP